jgi:hypothetical protein
MTTGMESHWPTVPRYFPSVTRQYAGLTLWSDPLELVRKCRSMAAYERDVKTMVAKHGGVALRRGEATRSMIDFAVRSSWIKR